MHPKTAPAIEDWFLLCHRCGVGLAAATAMSETLAAAYGEPHRHYHTLAHIQECLRLARHVHLADADRNDVEFALWFHDVVYDPRSADNEELSAVMAEDWLNESNIPGGERVGALIRMTAGHKVTADSNLATKVVHDVDLAILGSSPAAYDQYVADIREEYGWLEDHEFAAGRSGVLQTFRTAGDLYALQPYAEMFAEQARQNLERELLGLSGVRHGRDTHRKRPSS